MATTVHEHELEPSARDEITVTGVVTIDGYNTIQETQGFRNHHVLAIEFTSRLPLLVLKNEVSCVPRRLWV